MRIKEIFRILFVCSRFNVDDDGDGRMAEIKLNRKQPYDINTLNYHRRHYHHRRCHRHTTIIRFDVQICWLNVQTGGIWIPPLSSAPAPFVSALLFYSQFQLQCVQFMKSVELTRAYKVSSETEGEREQSNENI